MEKRLHEFARTLPLNQDRCKRLELRPAEQRARRGIPRSWDKLKPSMRDVLCELCDGRQPWPLLLHGRAGRGKTCVGLLMADVVEFSLYWTVEELIGVAFDGTASVWHYAEHSPLVVIDELATRGVETDREYAAVKKMADLREHKPAIWISNLPPRDLQAKYDDRIMSRIGCGTVIELTGDDRRRANR